MQIHEAYNDWSASYDSDRNLTRDLDHAVTRQALEGMRCDSVVELGCGTGKNTQLLSQIGKHVHALDFSPGMIEKARAKQPAPNVTFEIADITQPWPGANDSVDLIVCNLVLEHIEDLVFIFSEAARLLKSRGRFFVSELHPFRQYQGTVARFQRADAQMEIPAYIHHLTDFINAATANKLSVASMQEWWHEEDQGKPPRLVSFMFEKAG